MVKIIAATQKLWHLRFWTPTLTCYKRPLQQGACGWCSLRTLQLIGFYKGSCDCFTVATDRKPTGPIWPCRYTWLRSLFILLFQHLEIESIIQVYGFWGEKKIRRSGNFGLTFFCGHTWLELAVAAPVVCSTHLVFMLLCTHFCLFSLLLLKLDQNSQPFPLWLRMPATKNTGDQAMASGNGQRSCIGWLHFYSLSDREGSCFHWKLTAWNLEHWEGVP